MNCEDLLRIKEIHSGMKLVAGEKGVYRNIRWIYFADCIQCLEGRVSVTDLIHGEELVIITNATLTDNDDSLINMMDEMRKKNVSAFVINEGQISKRVIDYCNQIEVPLYELSVDLHLIDFSQIVCKVLVVEEGKTNSRERILTSILYSDSLNIEDLMDQAQFLGINLSGKYRAAVFTWKNEIKAEDKEEEGILIDRRNQVKKWIKNEFRSYGLKHLMIHARADAFVIMFPADFFSHDLLVTILKNILNKVAQSFYINLSVGVGTPYEYINDFKLSYQEAKNALKISKMLSEDTKIFFYDELDLYSFIAQISNGKFLDDYVLHKIGKLLDADSMQEGNLVDTLEAYLDHKCNANATAEALYIHRNTMRYRLDKIRHILNSDLSDLSECLELKLAFSILRYRSYRENGVVQ